MDLFDTIRTRRSIRCYQPQALERPLLEQILDAGRLAPSACNLQPWRFFVFEGEQVARLKEAYDRRWFLCAPAVICVCCNHDTSWKRPDGKDYGEVDCAIAIDHMTLAAAALGLGTCWIGAFKKEALCQLLSLAPMLEPIAMTPVGYPAQNPAMPARKELAEIIVWNPL